MQKEDGQLRELTPAQEKQYLEDARNGRVRTVRPIFTVGEIVIVKGGHFRIQSLGNRGMVLIGVPAKENK